MQNGDLNKALALTPLSGDPIPFVTFLSELKGKSGRVATAPAVVLRAIHDMGKEDYKEEDDPERRRFLQVLEQAGIPSWRAFYHVCGSQLFANRLLKRFLEPAAANGAQLKKMLIVEGGPGAGKDYFKDGIERALERSATVYAVKGCPEHENPINLLKLLPEGGLEQVAAAIDMPFEELEHLMQTANSPCQHCYDKVMGSLDEANKTPSLAGVEVEEIRLSSRSAGIFEWKPGQDCSLVAALRRANRGFISMPDAFLEREVEPGKTDERLVLLDATQYRRLPGLCTGSESTVAASPLDVFMFASTNANSLARFLESLPDPDAFTGRADQVKLPYNLFRVEEVRAYETELKRYDEVARFGPLALKMIATLAVMSRYAVPKKDDKFFIHPIDRMRLLVGEDVKVKPRSSSDWQEIWGYEKSADTIPAGSGRFGAGLESQRTAASYRVNAKSLPDDAVLTPVFAINNIASDEGLVGLDMRFMMSLLSRINQYGLMKTKKSRGKDSSVTALEAIMLLRQAIHFQLTGTSNLTEEQIEVLERCQMWLGGRPVLGETWTQESSAKKPGLIESEYRRLLKTQILHAFCPDYEERAQELFEDYVLHAQAWATGEKKVRHPKHKQIPVNEDLLKELDLFRLGKGKTGFIDDEELKFRRSLTTILSDKKDEFMAMECQAQDLEPDCQAARDLRVQLAKTYQATWRTVPELAIAIRAKLDTEIGDLVKKLLNTEVVSDLKTEEREKLEIANTMLEDLGYSKGARASVLEYAKKFEVWKHQS